MENKNGIFDHLKPRKTPIPDASYFESMAKSVIESQKKSPIIPLHKRPAVWICAVAAVFIAGILLVNFSSDSSTESDPLLALNEISSNDLYHYIDENIDDFDTELIGEALNESAVDELNFIEPEEEKIEVSTEKKPKNSISFDDIDAKDILDYFNDEGIDSADFDDDDSFI